MEDTSVFKTRLEITEGQRPYNRVEIFSKLNFKQELIS